jgi:hypothetical protein
MLESPVRHPGIEVEDALRIIEQVELYVSGGYCPAC